MLESKFLVLSKTLKKIFKSHISQCKTRNNGVSKILIWNDSENLKKQVRHLRNRAFSRKAFQRLVNRKPSLSFRRYLGVSLRMSDVIFLTRKLARKQLWGRSSLEVAVPYLSRGFKRINSLHTLSGDKEQETNKSDNKLITHEILEQKYYTEKLLNKPDLGDAFEKPPPQRCRLACPLPPSQFDPELSQEYIPHYQPPTVKYSSIPRRLLPQMKRKAVHDVKYSLTAQENRKRKRKLTEELPDLPQKNIKTYMNLQHVKSQMYPPKVEKPMMKALLFEPDRLELNFNSVMAPTKIFKDEVLVQVIYSGVSGTDIFMLEGKLECGGKPLILGHEISGKVYAVGSEVTHVSKNDKVAINPYTACSCCRYCSLGMFCSCENEGVNNCIGLTKNGGWAEFVVIKKSQVFKIPNEMGLEEAAIIQPLSRVLSAISKLNLQEGFVFVIQGLSLSGLLWASVLHSKGFKKVYVTDKNEHRIRSYQAMDLGYPVIPAEDLGKLTADVVVETSGSPAFIEKSFSILNPNGQLCFFGKPNPSTEIRCVPYDIIHKEISILGRCGNDFCFAKAIDIAATMGQRYLDFDKLDVGVFDPEDYKDAFRRKKTGEIGKVIFRFDS